MFRTDVVPSVHLLHRANVNCYLIEDGDALTLVDAGLPRGRSWDTPCVPIFCPATAHRGMGAPNSPFTAPGNTGRPEQPAG